ncbi:hypothetical protein COU58_00420 [Candidatus Pacearchaeota archaeon CG10_big_fil_rev_8_21_14_0_10_32_42]|nr:MAG: hypothetical protein COU58_00420 [Candidatus Pacearchaeota archaeon CG10_big_fil_rev_8_21_14_0_10_32_42]
MSYKESYWWAIYRFSPEDYNLINSEKDLIAFAKGTEENMQKIMLSLYYGNVKIKKEKPRQLNYKIKVKNKIVLHSMEKKEAIRISRLIIPEPRGEIRENSNKIWFKVSSQKNKTNPPYAYFRKKGDAEKYSSDLPDGEINTTKKPSKKLEFSVLDNEGLPVAIFKKNSDAKEYQKISKIP